MHTREWHRVKGSIDAKSSTRGSWHRYQASLLFSPVESVQGQPRPLTESHLPYLEQVCSLFVLEFGRNLQKFVHSQENLSMAL